jgi:hypothetical protein
MKNTCAGSIPNGPTSRSGACEVSDFERLLFVDGSSLVWLSAVISMIVISKLHVCHLLAVDVEADFSCRRWCDSTSSQRLEHVELVCSIVSWTVHGKGNTIQVVVCPVVASTSSPFQCVLSVLQNPV